MIRRPPRSTRNSFPTRRSSDLAESAGTGYGTRTPAQRQVVENLPRYATAFALRSNDRRVAGKFGIGYQVGTVMPHRPAQSPTVLLQVHSIKSAEVQREQIGRAHV